MKSKYLVFISIGFELIALILLGLAGAKELEKRFPSGGLITMAVVFLLVIGWFVHIFYLLRKIDKTSESNPDDPKNS